MSDKVLSQFKQEVVEEKKEVGKKLKVGIIGTGWIAESHIQSYKLQDDVEIVSAINAGDIEKSKVRGDLGITYDMDVLRLRQEFLQRDMQVSAAVITHCGWMSAPVQKIIPAREW